MIIQSYFGIEKVPFLADSFTLLPHQQEVFDNLRVHSSQGGFCLVLGEPGTGKTIIRDSIRQTADKRTVVVSVGRTLHTYTNILKIICQASGVDFSGSHFRCEKRLIEEALSLFRGGKQIILFIDDAHLMDFSILRRLRLMFEEFPKNNNVILIGQPSFLNDLSLHVNSDINSRVTYSVILPKLNPDDMLKFILSQFDCVSLPHNVFHENALSLVVRSSDGYLRRAKNLCISCLLEAVRSQKKYIDLESVNRVLMQPHWRTESDIEQKLYIK